MTTSQRQVEISKRGIRGETSIFSTFPTNHCFVNSHEALHLAEQLITFICMHVIKIYNNYIYVLIHFVCVYHPHVADFAPSFQFYPNRCKLFPRPIRINVSLFFLGRSDTNALSIPEMMQPTPLVSYCSLSPITICMMN